MKFNAILLFVFLSHLSIGQNLKLLNATVSIGGSLVRDPYRSFDYFKGYATDPSSLDADSIDFRQESPIVQSPASNHRTVWYGGQNLLFSVGFKPKKENKEISFGIQYSKMNQSSYNGIRSSSLPWDTLITTNSGNETDTLYSYFVATDYKNFELSNRNLFLTTEYLFKSKSTCVQYFAGLGLKVGMSVFSFIFDSGSSSIDQVLFNPTRNEYFVDHSPLNYPTWFFDQPQINFQGERFGSKPIFYFTPYLPFGMRIPLSQSAKFLSNFNLDLRGSIGLEAQMMKRNTLMIRQLVSGNIGLLYSFDSH